MQMGFTFAYRPLMGQKALQIGLKISQKAQRAIKAVQLALDFSPPKQQEQTPAAKPHFRFSQVQQNILYALKHEGARIVENPLNGYIRLEQGYTGTLINPRTLKALKRKQAIKEIQGDEWGTFKYWVFAH